MLSRSIESCYSSKSVYSYRNNSYTLCVLSMPRRIELVPAREEASHIRALSGDVGSPQSRAAAAKLIRRLLLHTTAYMQPVMQCCSSYFYSLSRMYIYYCAAAAAAQVRLNSVLNAFTTWVLYGIV